MKGQSSYNNDFFGLTLQDIVWKYGMLKPGDVKLVSAAGLDNPYFKPELKLDPSNKIYLEFTQQSVQTDAAPVADHEETLKLKFKDKYGHDVEISLPVTVKKPTTV